jgi:hypothetical protein
VFQEEGGREFSISCIKQTTQGRPYTMGLVKYLEKLSKE